ncbi:MAG: hypothetical protein KFB93_01405 [Simkaniaceae bacterium]|nr:MAG: hypothetical protein KFB93_01405 [Simkaniaceae bacterium]
MKFLVKDQKDQKEKFSLIYDDYQFLTDPGIETTGYGAITVNYLELQLDEDGRIAFLFGYEPLAIYEETNNFPKQYESKDLIAVLDNEPGPDDFPGLPTYNLVKNSEWPNKSEWSTYINKKEGWVCVGDPTIEDKRLIEFAPDCVAALDKENEMVAIWLHPRELPAHVYEKGHERP